MFGQRKTCIQVVKGRTHDAASLREASDRWYREVAPGARGWLGSTGGVTDDGVYFNLMRFDSPRAAHRNDRRRQQGQWWDEVSDLFEGEVTVEETTDVETFGRGGSDEAGFVQILQTHVRDREAVRPFVPEEAQRTLARLRPDMIGGMFCVHPDGSCTGVAYFTSWEAAREGERTEMPPDYKAWRDEQMTHFDQEAVFYDLREFWLQSP
ncbi:hypothetical protein E1287_31830 [Actinomadura sp. KC06]|uniref:hypothetical protein n=1 Tax=Actinomadura sp. KC06 TaxID=2530369 RepID=UPI00104FBFC2|nr:hypothetical protein [Actinomadura sp. KC06]TDD28990.1 hypothetical protein E1287_31830 [Actinomadura sp. KC06]